MKTKNKRSFWPKFNDPDSSRKGGSKVIARRYLRRRLKNLVAQVIAKDLE